MEWLAFIWQMPIVVDDFYKDFFFFYWKLKLAETLFLRQTRHLILWIIRRPIFPNKSNLLRIRYHNIAFSLAVNPNCPLPIQAAVRHNLLYLQSEKGNKPRKKYTKRIYTSLKGPHAKLELTARRRSWDAAHGWHRTCIVIVMSLSGRRDKKARRNSRRAATRKTAVKATVSLSLSLSRSRSL